MNIGQNIAFYRKERKLTQEQLAKKLNVSDVSVSLWESGQREPRMGRIQQIADVLGVKTDKIIFGENYPRIINDYSEYEKRRFEHITKEVKSLYEETMPPQQNTLIKVYGSIAAGLPLEAIEDVGEIACPWIDNKIHTEEMFALKVNGDSMDRVVQDGYYAVFKKQNDVRTGEIAAVFINGGEATLKRVLKFSFSKKLILEPLSHNPIHQEQQYGEFDDIRIIGKYIGCISPYGFEIE